MDGREPDLDLATGVGAHLRHDSADKHVSGAAVYADDAPEPRDLVHCALILASIARGKVRVADLSEVRAAPGVLAVLTGDDAPGENNVGPVVHDEPMLALSRRPALDGTYGDVHFHGQPLALVVADSREQARRAARLAQISYAEETPLLTIADAMAAGSFIAPPYRMARGDAAAAIAAAPMKRKGGLAIGGQEHFYLEGQVSIAYPGEDEEMRVLSSNQHPSECQQVVARVLGTPLHSVVIEARRLGGAFGGKESQANLPAAAAALAARLLGRPAKLRLDRDEDMIVTGKRHEFEIEYEVGFDLSGKILGLRVEQKARCGWSADLSNAICDRAMFHADNCYALPAVEIVSHRCRTNTVSNTAFRGFGGPQGMVGAEHMIEQIAAALGLDPLLVRRRNFYAPPAIAAQSPAAQSTTPYHMVVEDCVIAEIVDELAQSAAYARRREEIAAWNDANPVLKRGLSLTPVKFGISFTTSFLNQAGALAHLYQDGSMMLNHGGIEMGQGLYQKVAQVAASELGLDIGKIKITATRTDKVPNTSATAASSGSDLNGMAVRDACRQLKERLTRFAAEKYAVAEADVAFLPNRVRVGAREIEFAALVKEAYLARIQLSAAGFYATPKIHWDKEAAQGRPFYYFAYGAAVSEAIVDTLTGENKILRADILHDVGKSLNPALDLGQIEGGYVQGMGWLTMEELWWSPAGALKTHAPSTYKIPCASDRPDQMNIKIWPKGENRELTIRRSKAVGEPPLMLAISAFTAIGEAVRAAGGDRFALDAPATPERVLAAIQGRG
ncbi:MAG: xanthine dehydrogenase molybdopterin binding subunit [Neomegalonema sp.]|nr:xanthine dehydrogenase molybdopterin binding subunit [Neomegalonema sp.]